MRRPIIRLLVAVSTIIAGCLQIYATSLAADATQQAQMKVLSKEVPKSTESKTDFTGYNYTPPTEEEMAPMRPEYLAVLAKVHEPPEMTGKPMQVRKIVSPNVAKLWNVMSAVHSPEKATHEQRAAAIKELLAFATSKDRDDEIDRPMIYGAIAAMACIDDAEPQAIIGYANNALGDGDDALYN